MRKNVIAALIAGGLSLMAVQPVAQASLATTLSTKVADKIVSSIAGEAAGHPKFPTLMAVILPA